MEKRNTIFKKIKDVPRRFLFLLQKIKFIHLFWIFFYLVLFGLLIHNGFSYLDPDFGWHLKVGQEISYTHQVPSANLYNYTYTGNWVDHEWLSNLALYQIYNRFSYITVVISFALLIIITLIIQNVFIKSRDKSLFWLIAIFQCFGVIASINHFGVRMQELALLFTLLLLIIIEVYNKHKNYRILIALPPLMFLWANMHASFLIGFFILFSWIAIKLLERNKYIRKIKQIDFSDTSELKKIYYLAIATLASLFTTCLTPYGLKLYSFLFGYKNKAYLSLIEEWLPQSALPLNLYQLVYLAIGAMVIFIYIYECLQNKKGINIWKIFLPLVFLVLSFESKRHFPLFFIVSFEIIIDFYSSLFAQIKINYSKYLKILTIVCLGSVVGLQFLKINLVRDPFTNFCDRYPCTAISFLKDNPQYKNLNLFNEYGWGGFMIWTIPERKLFIDGRLPQVEFSHWTFIEEYYDFLTNKNDIPKKLKEYNIRLVLTPSHYEPYVPKPWEQLFFPVKTPAKSKNQLQDYLDNSIDWNLIYQDKTAKIYFYNQQ